MAKKDENIVTLFQFNPSVLDKYSNKYLGVFQEFIQDENDFDAMVGAVAVINTLIAPLFEQEAIDKKTRDDIIAAWEYAESKMMKTKSQQKKIMEYWGGDFPLLFKVGVILHYEKNKERIEFETSLLDEEQQLLFAKIMRAVWTTKEKRRLVCGTLSVGLPKTIRKDAKEQYEYMVRDIINTFLLADSDVLIFAIERKEGDTISALVNKGGRVSIVPTDTLKMSYARDAFTGEEVGPPPGEKYMEFPL